MSENSEPTAAAAPTPYKDRKIGLVAFGIFEIILGGICVLLVPLMAIGMLIGRANPATRDSLSLQAMLPNILMYVLFAVLFIWLGIGSIQARRWARALMLVGAWIWLVSGLVGIVFWLLLMPDFYALMARNGQLPAGVITVIKIVTTLVITVIYVLLPLAFILFYGSRHVKATCEARDPQRRWTDKCPLPVLGLCLLYGSWAIGVLWLGANNCVVPAFGKLVSGYAGFMILALATVAIGYIVPGLYRLRPAAWWVAVLFTLVAGASSVLTFAQINLVDYYRAMGFAEAQLAAIRQYSTAVTPLGMTAMTVSWVLAMLVYLILVRGCFLPSGSSGGRGMPGAPQRVSPTAC